jgi:arsenate reductase
MRILFLCKDNGSRSQMAEALARSMFGSEIDVLSAGVQPGGRLHPLALASMREVDLDISHHQVKTLQHVDATTLNLVVVVCERDVSIDHLPKTIKKLHWPLMDPLDPPAPEQELRNRFLDLRIALSKHLKGIGKVRRQVGAEAAR